MRANHEPQWQETKDEILQQRPARVLHGNSGARQNDKARAVFADTASNHQMAAGRDSSTRKRQRQRNKKALATKTASAEIKVGNQAGRQIHEQEAMLQYRLAKEEQEQGAPAKTSGKLKDWRR
jgi:hypothetical protein